MSDLKECKGCGVSELGISEDGYCIACQYEHEAKQDEMTDNDNN